MSVIAVCVVIFVQSLADSLSRRIYGVYTDIYTDAYYDCYNDINPLDYWESYLEFAITFHLYTDVENSGCL